MNESELNNRTSKSETYRATTNLNIDMENPQINMNSVVGVNIKDVENSYSNNQNFAVNSNNSFNNDNFNQTTDFSNNYNSTFNTNVSEQSQSQNQFITSDLNSNVGQFSEPIVEVPSNDKIVYEPTMKENKKKSQGFSIPIELKVTFFIVLILIIFVLLMPYIYDFFKSLQLSLIR